jgi:hypothetical protein
MIRLGSLTVAGAVPEWPGSGLHWLPVTPPASPAGHLSAEDHTGYPGKGSIRPSHPRATVSRRLNSRSGMCRAQATWRVPAEASRIESEQRKTVWSLDSLNQWELPWITPGLLDVTALNSAGRVVTGTGFISVLTNGRRQSWVNWPNSAVSRQYRTRRALVRQSARSWGYCASPVCPAPHES